MEIKRFVYETEEDWLKAREKVFTSSEMNRLMAEPSKKAKEAGQRLSDGAITYILEKLTAHFNNPKPRYYNAEMDWGKENEGAAVLELCEILGLSPLSNDVIYTSVNGWVFFTNNIIGGTPDVIFPNLKKIAEIKCPNSDNHLYYKAFINAKNFQSELPKYYDQMQANMYFAKADSCYFMSYDPRFKDSKRSYHIIEIERNQERIDQILAKVEIAHEMMLKLINTL
jgi:hypothetical protein